MHPGRLGTGIRIVIVIAAIGCGRAFGGFTDHAFAGEIDMPLSEQVLADGEELLDFSITGESNGYVPPVQTLTPRSTPPAAAPLPVALLPGGIMIAGSFILTRVFKRRIV